MPDYAAIDAQAQGPCDLHVEHDLNAWMAFNWQIRWLRSLENSVNELCRSDSSPGHIGVHLKQCTCLSGKRLTHRERNPVRLTQFTEQLSLKEEKRTLQ